MKAKDLANRLSRLDLCTIARTTMLEHAETIAELIRDELSKPHNSEFLDSSANILQASITVSIVGGDVLVASDLGAAIDMELGTIRKPPRPFLAPVAAERAQVISQAIGKAVDDAFREG